MVQEPAARREMKPNVRLGKPSHARDAVKSLQLSGLCCSLCIPLIAVVRCHVWSRPHGLPCECSGRMQSMDSA